MNKFHRVMQWVTKLPEVGEPILQEREAIFDLMREAEQLEREAAEKRIEVARAALTLEHRIRNGIWSKAEIDAAIARSTFSREKTKCYFS